MHTVRSEGIDPIHVLTWKYSFAFLLIPGLEFAFNTTYFHDMIQEMSAASSFHPPQAAYTSEMIYRLTVAQYHELISGGILTSDDPVELLEGVLVYKMPKNPPHSNANGRIADLFRATLPVGWHFRSQEPLTLLDGEPEPDGAIVRGTRDDFALRHPKPAEVGLLLEVANTTLERDRDVKLRSYARAGIVCYWIVNLIDRQVEVYTDPDSSAKMPTYRQKTIIAEGMPVSLGLNGQWLADIACRDLLPAR